jgi:hypothetical protein
MPYKSKHPPIRVTEQAFEHLCKIVNAHKIHGIPASLTSISSTAILALPIPQNGDGLTPCPECGALKVDGHSQEEKQ